MLLGGDLVDRSSSRLESGQIGDGGLGDRAQRLGCKVGLVPGNQHIGEGQKRGEDIVPNDLIGQILEEQLA